MLDLKSGRSWGGALGKKKKKIAEARKASMASQKNPHLAQGLIRYCKILP